MRLSRHQLWSGSSYDGAACRPRRCPVQVVPSDQPQLCGSVKLVPMADLSALPSCSTSPWRQTLERPRKNSHHARSTRTPTHTSPAGSNVSSSKFQFSTFSVPKVRNDLLELFEPCILKSTTYRKSQFVSTLRRTQPRRISYKVHSLALLSR